MARIGRLAKWWLVLGWIALLPGAPARADEKFDSLVVGSTTYSNVTVLNKTRMDVFITHEWGLANIKVQDLDFDAQVKLGYQLPKEESSGSLLSAPKMFSNLESPEDFQKFEQELPPELLAMVEAVAEMEAWVPYAIVGGIAFVYLLFCFLCRQVCVKTGQEPSVLIWLPILKQFPMLRAAKMSAWWFLLNFIGLWGIRSLVWCFKIATAREKHWFLGLLLALPVTNVIVFLYLAFSKGVNGSDSATPPVHSKPNRNVITLQGGGRQQEAA